MPLACTILIWRSTHSRGLRCSTTHNRLAGPQSSRISSNSSMVLWHASDTCLPWLGPVYTSGPQRSNERHLDHFLAAVSAELKGAPQTESQQRAMWVRIRLALRNIVRETVEANERALDTLLDCGFLEATT